MGMLLHSLEQYCKHLNRGIYTGAEFNRCREKMIEIREALAAALKRKSSPKFR
jgi:hypothetical protein